MRFHLTRDTQREKNEPVVIQARRDWRILCLLFAFLFAIVAWWGRSLYGRIERSEFVRLAPRASASSAGVDRAQVQKTLQFFAERQAAFDQLFKLPLDLAGPGPSPPKRP